jgi:cytochrome b561
VLDATLPWPSDRRTIDAGVLTLTDIETEGPGNARDVNFDPLVLPDGIEPTDDPLLSARSAVYAMSYRARTGEVKMPSIVQVDEVARWTAPIRYPIRTRILHWLTAVLVFSALFIGFVMVNSLGSYASLRPVHMTLGVLILVIVVVRAANRFTHRVPKLPDTVGWLEHKLVVGSELTMYATLASSAADRMGHASASGQSAEVYGSLDLPRIAPFNADLYFILRQTHSLFAYALVAVIAAHVSAVLLHTLTLRDGMPVPDGVCASNAVATPASERVCTRHTGQLCESAHVRARRGAVCST